ncbi:L-aspartate oxidase [Tropicimonas sp. IMCC34043]|uniref:L-aspartate oxidase n=1 Tax=Tropicimonas sp. IMCC34043 TaxID=2248760 RepID=UPI000E2305E2|nr:L-aspartate oxidase [Tropicimonas sp. IMCC34043]
MNPLSTDRVVILGAGLGALYAAISLAPRPVLVISPEPLGLGASSAWAQGGVAAAMNPEDSAESHAADTARAGAGTVDPSVARSVTAEARDHILGLTALGTPFDRTGAGSYVLSREAAHSFARVVRVKGDQAGAEIMARLIATVAELPSVQVLEGVMAVGLSTEDGAVTGVFVQPSDAAGGAPVLIRAPACLLAGGGSAGLYAITTNPPRIRGQVIGMAARAGAVIADPEFVQFHPTAIDVGEDPAPLASEALRGEGAVLVNRLGERFMTAEHPDAELAPRDIVARAVFAQTKAGLRPMLDTRAALGDRVETLFPAVAEACRRNGIDPVARPIPVAAAAHYHMGGIRTDDRGRASLGRLWVCGEAGSTGLHGANRLASNGLLEAMVYGRRAASDIAEVLGPAPDTLPELVVDFETGGEPADDAAVAALRQVMTDKVGVIRNAAGLTSALRAIAKLERDHGTDESFRNMTATATLIAAGALLRQESRGAHCRDDFPRPLAEATRTMLTLQAALALRDKTEQEPQ